MANVQWKPNLRSLECFKTIIETGSASAASRQLGMSQPGVSRVLSVLEAGVGFPLFLRDRGHLVPTPEAIILHKEIDVALKSVGRVADLARNLQNANFGELSIVAPPSFAEGVLSEVVASFIDAHPNVRVTVDSQSVEQAIEMVALRAVDCGFVKLPARHPGILCEPLIKAGTVCAMAENHKLARKRTVSVKDLNAEPLILLGKGRASREQIDLVFREQGASMNIKVETHTVGSACGFARSGVGIAIVNEMLSARYGGPGLVFRRFGPNFVHEYAFMRSRETPMTRVTEQFLDHCRLKMRSHGAASR